MLVFKFLLTFLLFTFLKLESSVNPSSKSDLMDLCTAAPIRKTGCKVASDRVIEEAKALKKRVSKKRGSKFSNNTPCDNLSSATITELSGISSWPRELVYDQGKLGACSANALAFCIRYLSIRNSSDPTNFIDNPELLSPSRLYLYYNTRYLEGIINGKNFIKRDTGASIDAAILALDKYGCCPEKSSDDLKCSIGTFHYAGWDYNIRKFSVQPPPENYRFALDESYNGLKIVESALKDSKKNPYKIITQNIRYVDLGINYDKKDSRALNAREKKALIENFKAVLSDNIPIFYGLDHDSNFERKNNNAFITTPNLDTFSTKNATGHAIVIVGYGSYNPSIPKVNYFKFINSWGPDWGDNGFGYLEEDYITNHHLFCVGGFSIDLVKGEM